ncbi:hypothetical protein FNH22_14895 [Fulvivirga sp. M361]|uniref:hypothetical protein n=1 Tax=Fulvivirga sp. M361 TaxID=2594266 RepID=UPI00117A8AD5|nr:hypothetical protein [Fulvivirga sp. M361]TRX57697.1 hypothetical protein FNH22_14895 [Fulvivirga sp. M361]
MFLRLIPLLLFFAFYHPTQAQRYLVLSKVNKPRKQIIFNEGETIRFRLKGERFFTSASILGLGNDEIRFHYYRIKLDEIEEIDIRNKNFTIFNFKNWSGIFLVAGPLFLVIDQFNQTAIMNESFRVSSETATISGAFVATGLLLRVIGKKRWKCNKKKHRMQILDFRVK